MMSRWLGLLAALLALGAAHAADSYLLPQEAVPVSYDLKLIPYLEAGDRQFTFDGSVAIVVRAKKAVPTITLHADDITVLRAEVSGLKVLTTEIESTRQFLILNLNESLKVGAEYTISIDYLGNIRSQLNGFYRSSYTTASGERRWLGVTQFEPTSARRAFPSFDEPGLKATFDISIAPPNGLHAVSNMPEVAITGPDSSIGNRFWFKFAKSVPMSSYLVAFLVSDFGYLRDGTHRIYGKGNSIETAQYALSISPVVLEIMANFTGHPYQLPKMDQVAVPDFSAGAMENWGLVTYREQYLLLNEETENRKRSCATIMAHEYGHQWFGNQVSPQWWTYTWLNEAFASFFEYVDANKINPEWQLLNTMVTSMQHNVMSTDSSTTTHPITRYVETPSQISGSFDSITYSKGGSLIKMVSHFLTDPTFYKGLNIYLSDRGYLDAEPDDLFSAWQEAAKEDGSIPEDLTVNEIMNTWTLQAGYPVLTVERDYEAGTATITQKRFYSSGSQIGTEEWYVPISYTTSSEKNFVNTAPKVWLKPGEPLNLTGISADDWLILNIQDASFIRINYDAENWKRVLAALDQEDLDDIHVLNRAQILNDLSALSRAGLLPPGVALSGLRFLRNEKSYAVWTAAFRYFDDLYDKLAGSDALPSLKAKLRPLLNKIVSEVGLQTRVGESTAASLLRPLLVRWACALEHSSCAPVASYLLMRNEQRVSEDVRGALWCAGVRVGGNAAWDAAWERYTEARDAPERRDALNALACAPDTRRLLEAAVEDGETGLKAQDIPAGLVAACGAGRPAQCEKALELVRTNMHQIADRLGGAEEVYYVLNRMAPRLRTEGQLDAMRAAIAAAQLAWPRAFAPEAVERLLKEAETAASWTSTDGLPFVQWLGRERSF